MKKALAAAFDKKRGVNEDEETRMIAEAKRVEEEKAPEGGFGRFEYAGG